MLQKMILITRYWVDVQCIQNTGKLDFWCTLFKLQYLLFAFAFLHSASTKYFETEFLVANRFQRQIVFFSVFLPVLFGKYKEKIPMFPKLAFL